MKKILSLIIFILLIMPFNIFAKEFSFVNSYNKYTFVDEEVSCMKDAIYLGPDSTNYNFNYVFKQSNGDYYKYTLDKECIKMTNEEILNFLNLPEKEYQVFTIKESSNEYGINLVTTIKNSVDTKIIKTNDTTPVAGKTYYEVTPTEIVSATGVRIYAKTEVENLTSDTDVSNYYEEILVDYLRSTEFDSSLTYYKETDILYGEVVEVVPFDELKEEDILSYYILGSSDTVTKKMNGTIPEELASYARDNKLICADGPTTLYAYDDINTMGDTYIDLNGTSYDLLKSGFVAYTNVNLVYFGNTTTSTAYIKYDGTVLYEEDELYMYLAKRNLQDDVYSYDFVIKDSSNNYLIRNLIYENGYALEYELEGIEEPDTNFLPLDTDLEIKLTAFSGYKLPSSIEIKSLNSTIDSTNYSYDSTTGEIKLSKDYISKPITIIATGEKLSGEANPNTSDNIVTSIIALISGILLLGGCLTFQLKK